MVQVFVRTPYWYTLSYYLQSAEKKLAAIQEWTAIIRKFSDLSVIDRAIVDELIDRIEIGERYYTEGQRKQDIKIFYRFVGQVQ